MVFPLAHPGWHSEHHVPEVFAVLPRRVLASESVSRFVGVQRRFGHICDRPCAPWRLIATNFSHLSPAFPPGPFPTHATPYHSVPRPTCQAGGCRKRMARSWTETLCFAAALSGATASEEEVWQSSAQGHPR